MVGERIRSLRGELQLTQKELADKLEITRSALSLYETNKREPDYATIKRIADFFGVTVDYLVGRSDKKKSTDTDNLPQTIAADLPEGWDKLPPEAREDVIDFIKYVRQKYGKKDNG